MPKEIPDWQKQLIEREPGKTSSVLDVETLAPRKEKIEKLEKELKALDDFLNLHFDVQTKPQRSDFVELFRNLDTVAPPNVDSIAAALSGDLLERTLVYVANRLQNPPPVFLEILNELQHKGEDKPLEQISEYVKTLRLGIVENKKKVLWQLTEYIGIKKSAAIFEEQDLIKERAYPDFLWHLKEDEVLWLKSGDPEAAKAVELGFNTWYEDNKEKYLNNREKIRGEVEELSKKLDNKTAYKIIEKHLATTPQEIFELLESQARISSKKTET